jgi:PilZ domain
MSAKQIRSISSLESPVKVAGRQSALELSADKVSIHKSGIEFRSPTPFHEWSEMTVTLQSPLDGSRLSCHGVVVGCAGNKHTGYHVSMLFTSLTPQTQKQLGVMARSEFGAG